MQAPRLAFCFTLMFFLPFSRCQAQSFENLSGSLTSSQSIEPPKSTGILGQHDPAALSEIALHLRAVGAIPWVGLQGTGQITFGSTDQTSYPATLFILGSSGFRLDSQTATGPMSIRIFRRSGKIQEADGRKFPILPNTALSGLFQFELPRTVSLRDTQSSLLDKGSSTVEGISLHRLTFESPAVTPATPGTKVGTVATDLYFDQVSNLVVKSSNQIQIDGAGNNQFLRVITYEDYRQVGNTLIPFRYIQTLDGQKQWTLQLTEVQLNPTLNPTFFAF